MGGLVTCTAFLTHVQICRIWPDCRGGSGREANEARAGCWGGFWEMLLWGRSLLQPPGCGVLAIKGCVFFSLVPAGWNVIE